MSRNSYDDAFGVCALEWHQGAPSDGDGRPVLVEVWRASVGVYEATKPRAVVAASLEMRVRVEGQWKTLRYGGGLEDARDGVVRRHAYMRSRWWHATIKLDGWGT